MMMKILGLLLLFLSYKSLIYGFRFKDGGYGAKLTNVRAIGVSLLLLVLAIASLFTSKSFCQIFGVLC